MSLGDFPASSPTCDQVLAACAEESARVSQLAAPALTAFLTAAPGSVAHDLIEAHFREHRMPYSLANRRDVAVELSVLLAKDLAESLDFEESSLIEQRLSANGLK